MVNFTHKNKLGGKKRTNKRKVSSRKYKKRGGMMFDGFKGIKVKLYDVYLPDPIGEESTLHKGDKIVRISDEPTGYNNKIFLGYHPEKKLIHIKDDDTLAFKYNKMVDGKRISAVSTYLKPEEFDGKFKIFASGVKKKNIFGQYIPIEQKRKIKLPDINNIEIVHGGGGKRKTLKKSKKSKKVKKSRKNRK